MLQAVLAHGPLLMGQYSNITARFSCAEQNEVRLCVRREKRIRAAIIYFSIQQTAGAGQAPALMADGWQDYSVAGSSIPDKFSAVARERSFAFSRFQSDVEGLGLSHATI